jgi:ParB family chromosome partitioning protein
MTTKKKRLGRGLDALLSKPAARPDPLPDNKPSNDGLTMIPVEHLQRGQYQPRVDIRQDSLQELANSIQAQGIVQPIVARPVASGKNQTQRYEIVAGERRWRAAQMAGLHEVPAIIRDIPDESAIAMALIENIQREDLNPIEGVRCRRS